MKVFSTHPELHRAFLFGLQGKKVQKAHSYMLDTQGKPIGGYTSPYGILPAPAAIPAAIAKKEQHQVGLLRNLAPPRNVEGAMKTGDAKKKDLTRPAIKQEELPVRLFKNTFAPDNTNDRGTEVASAPTQRPDSERLTREARLECIKERVAERMKKRSASPTLVQKNAKQPKLSKPAQSSSKALEEKEMKKGGSSSTPAAASGETTGKAQGSKTPEANGKGSAQTMTADKEVTKSVHDSG